MGFDVAMQSSPAVARGRAREAGWTTPLLGLVIAIVIAGVVDAVLDPDALRGAAVILAAGWAVAAFGAHSAGHPALVAATSGVAVAGVAAAVWPQLAPLAVAGWLLVGLALPDGRLTTAPRRVIAAIGLAGGVVWGAWLVVAGRDPTPGPLVAAALVTGLIGIVAGGWRCSRARADRRQTLQWAAAATIVGVAVVAVFGALDLIVDAPSPLLPWVLTSLVLIPLGVAGGLFPRTARAAEKVLVEAIVAAGLTVLVVAAYLVVVVGLWRSPVGGERDILLASLAAALVVAVLALPTRSRLLAAGRSLVGRGGIPPEEAVSTFGARMSRAVPLDELLLQLAESLQSTLGPAGAEVWVGSDGVLTRTVSVPNRPSQRVVLGEQELVVVGRARTGGTSWCSVWLPALVADEPDAPMRVAPVAHLGELLGLLVVRRPVGGTAFSDEDERVLVELARQVGLALHNVQLDSALQASLEELRHRNVELQASRLRIVTAADESRRAIERNLHDGAQQHLVALAVKLGLARQILDSDPAAASGLLEELRTDVQLATATLRELAHGIYPPLLRDRGLGEALRTVATRSVLDCAVEVDLPGRYPAEVEAAVYFCCLEAIQNAGKYAGEASTITVLVDADASHVRFAVVDDGAGFDGGVGAVEPGQGFVNMRDRLGALAGVLEVESGPGAGATVRGSMPATPITVAGGAR